MGTVDKDINTICEAFGLGKVSLIGHSSGGLMTMHYAIAHGDRVENMILLNSMDASYTHDPALKGGYIAGIRSIKASPRLYK